MSLETIGFEKRNIKLPKGGELEVSLTNEFLQAVRLHFSLSENESVEDDHIRMFIFSSTQNAFEKAENAGYVESE